MQFPSVASFTNSSRVGESIAGGETTRRERRGNDESKINSRTEINADGDRKEEEKTAPRAMAKRMDIKLFRSFRRGFCPGAHSRVMATQGTTVPWESCVYKDLDRRLRRTSVVYTAMTKA